MKKIILWQGLNKMNKDIKLSETPADERLAEIIGRFPELNMSNYTDVEVDRLNAWGIELCEAWDDTRPVAPTVSSSAAPILGGYSIDDYRNAPSGIGPKASEWDNKPHRLLYDLCAALATPSVQAVAAPVAGVTNAARVKNTLVINGSKDQIAAPPVELTEDQIVKALDAVGVGMQYLRHSNKWMTRGSIDLSQIVAAVRHLSGDIVLLAKQTAAQGGK